MYLIPVNDANLQPDGEFGVMNSNVDQLSSSQTMDETSNAADSTSDDHSQSQPPTMHQSDRSVSDPDLSFVVLESYDQSNDSSQSLPDLCANSQDTTQVPPNYYQLCISDLIKLKSEQESLLSNGKSLTDESSNQADLNSPTSMYQHLLHKIGTLREENFRLVATVLKNNDDIKSLLSQHQKVRAKLDELSSENQKLRKTNFELEDKIQQNSQEIKLLCSDMDDLQAVNRFLREEVFKAKNDNLQISKDLDAAKELHRQHSLNVNSQANSEPKENMFRSWNETCGRLCSLPVERENAPTIDVLKDHSQGLIDRRMGQLETKLEQVSSQSLNICVRLDQCLQRLTEEESLKTNAMEQLRQMGELNRLLQFKLFGLDSLNVQSSLTSHIAPASKESQEKICSASDSVISTQNSTYNSQKVYQKGKLTASVSPLRMETPIVSSVEPSTHHYEQASYSRMNSNETSEISAADQRMDHDSSNRRHRRHHRIKLFSHRRRH